MARVPRRVAPTTAEEAEATSDRERDGHRFRIAHQFHRGGHHNERGKRHQRQRDQIFPAVIPELLDRLLQSFLGLQVSAAVFTLRLQQVSATENETIESDA